MSTLAKTAAIRKKKKNRFENWDLIIFMGPFLITFFLFTVLPVFVSWFVGFTNFNMLQVPDWVWFDNYQKLLLNDSLFGTAVQWSLIIGIVTGPVSYILCFAFAWLINEVPAKPRAFLTLLFYAPSLSGGFGFVWGLLFSGDRYGYINSLLLKLGIISDPIQWIVNKDYMFTIFVIMTLWGALGSTFLTFIAGLQTVDRSLYEAGAVDGIKNRWQELYHITLPAMRGQLIFGAILNITSAFTTTAGFFGNPPQDYYMYTIMNHLDDYGGTRMEMGYACAIATILFLFTFAMNKVFQFIISRIGK